MNRLAILLIALCCALPAAAQMAPALDTNIVFVRVVGPWQSGGSMGFSRLVAKGSGTEVALTVEWISTDGQVVQTAPLSPPPGAEQLPLAKVRNAEGAVYFDTAQGDTFVLRVGAPGDAQFGAASN